MPTLAAPRSRELTADERTSLTRLCAGAREQKIPAAHAEAFLDLGLAEVCCGGLALTSAGRAALRRAAIESESLKAA